MVVKLELVKKGILLTVLLFLNSMMSQSLSKTEPTEAIKKLQSTTSTVTKLVMEDTNGELVDYTFKEIDNGFSKELKKKYPEIRTFEGTSVLNSSDVCFVTITNDRIFGTSFSGKSSLTFYNDKKGIASKFVYTKEEEKNSPICGDCNAGSSCRFDKEENDNSVALSQTGNSFGKKDSTSKSLASDGVTYSRGPVSKEYRFALTVTYAQNVASGNTTVAEGLAYATSKLASINRVFGSELAIKFTFVPNEDLLIFLTPDDPFPDAYVQDILPLLDINQTTTDKLIGNENYDWGFVIHPCWTGRGTNKKEECTSNRKAKAGSGNIDDDLILHEMGHQMSAPHSYHLDNADGINRITSSMVGNNGKWLHSVNFEITAKFVDANTCGVTAPTGNHVPDLTIPFNNNLVIPKETPYVLTGFATDVDPTAKLTYTWQQAGILEAEANLPEKKLLFAHKPPTPENYVRYIPDLNYQLSNTPDPSAKLSSISRDIVTRFIVRDNQEPFGSTIFKEMSFNVDDTAGPFLVSFGNKPSLAFTGEQKVNITWDVANTNNKLVNAQFVNILLSVDQAKTWTTLASNVINNGSFEVVLPNVVSTMCRIKVEAVGNIFYDMSDYDFEIVDKAANDFKFSQYDVSKAVFESNTCELNFRFTKLGDFKNSVNVYVDKIPDGSTVTNVKQLNDTGDFSVTLSNIKNVAKGAYPIEITLEEQGGVKLTKKLICTLINKSVGEVTPGNALSLKKSSQYATAPIKEIITNTFTISAWVKPKSGLVYSGMLFFGSETGVNIYPDGRPAYNYKSLGYAGFSSTGPKIEIDKWNHIALVIEPNKATFYINGKASTPISKYHTPISLGTILNIGRQNSGRNFLGEIDEVKIFNKSLSAIEVQEQIHKIINYNDDSLIAYYQFNESDGNAISPVSFYNATLIGSASREVSSIPVGKSEVKTLNKSLGSDYENTDVNLKFGANSTNENITVHKINGIPYNLSGIPVDEIGDATDRYWEINSYPTDSLQSKDIGFKFNKDIAAGDLPSNYSLYTRDQTSDGEWIFLSKANFLDAKLDSVSFKDVSKSGQFVVTRNTASLSTSQWMLPDRFMIYKKGKDKVIVNSGTVSMSSIRVYDVTGKLLIYKNNINEVTQELDTLMPHQLLIIKVTLSDNNLITRKFMN